MESAQLALIAKRENVLLELAGSQKYLDKLSLFCTFACTHFSPGTNLAIADNKGKILTASTNEKIVEKRRFELDSHHSIIIDSDIEQDVQSLLKQQFARLKVKGKKSYTFFYAALVIFALFLPITRSVTSEGVAIHDANSTQISVRSPGQLSKINIVVGEVKKGDVLAKIKNTQVYKLSEAQAQLELVENQLIEQGAFSTTNINHLKFEKERLLALVDQINVDLASNQIIAPESGVLSWKPGVAGSYVQFGQTIGSIDPIMQDYVTAYINLDDWAGNQIGDKAQFITQSLKKIKGSIIDVGKGVQRIDGQLKTKIVIKLNQKIATGTNGTVTLRGESTRVGLWLLNKPIIWLLSKF